jgi:anti-repressor protein
VIALNMIVIPLQIGTEITQGLDARELHAFLGVATPFTDWIGRRLTTYGFAEGLDFHAELRGSQCGRPAKEYAISLSMAKELAMVERGEKGRQARAYFLECERRAKAAGIGMSRPALAEVDARLDRLEHQAAEHASKAAAFDHLAALPGAVCLREAAKLLSMKPKQFTAWLSENGWIFRMHDFSRWQAYARRIDEGVMLHVLVPITRGDGRQELRAQAKVTPKGLTTLARLLMQGLESANRTPGI